MHQSLDIPSANPVTRKACSVLVAAMVAAFALSACADKDEPRTEDPDSPTAIATTETAGTGQAAGVEDDGTRVVRTDSPDDVRLATDVLMKFVESTQVDARKFSVVVQDGVLSLTSAETATDEEKQAASALARTVDGIASVRLDGTTMPEAVDARAVEARAIVEESNTATVDEEETQEDEQAQSEQAGTPVAEAAVDEEDLEDTPDDEAPAATPEEPDDYRSYTIKRGDTLSIIAARELGSGARWMELYQLNRSTIGSNPDGIRDGMVIKLPAE